jgi:F-box and WD-40 domain protein MET30
MIKMDFLTMLPNELSFKILGYLDTISLCTAAQVSRNWNRLAEDDVVWHQMCEQHIAKKCKRCGWGLPVPDRNRLLKEKKAMDARAAATPVTPFPAAASHSEVCTGSKRPLEDQDAEYEPKRQRLPWKEVYRNRFKVGTNWKYGRYNLKVLEGHKNGVMCVQIQDDILASGSYDATIKIWSLETGEELRTLEGHSSGIRCLQFHQKTQLVSGSMDKKVKIWNWQTGECIRTFYDRNDPNDPLGDVLSVHCITNFLCSGGKDNRVKVWDFAKKRCHTLRGHGDFVNSVRLDPDSRTVFSGSDDCTVRLWDLDTHQVLKTFHGHVGGIQQVVLLPEEFDLDEFELKDCDLPSVSEDHDIHWQRDRSVLPNPPVFPNDPTRKSPPQFMMTASLDSTIRLWHVPTAHCLRTLFGHVEGICAYQLCR